MIESRRIYIDTSPYIYYLEKNLEFGNRVKEFLMCNYNSGNEFITSAITTHLCLTQEARLNWTKLFIIKGLVDMMYKQIQQRILYL